MSKEIVKEFNDYELSLIHNKLLLDSSKGISSFYEVLVNGVKIISRTDQADQFRDFERFVHQGKTKDVLVKIFKGESQHSDTYKFMLKAEGAPVATPQPLAGIETRMDLIELSHKHEIKEVRWENEKKELLRDIEIYKAKLEAREEEVLDLRANPPKKTGTEQLGELLNMARPFMGQPPVPSVPQLGSVATTTEPSPFKDWIPILEFTTELKEGQKEDLQSIVWGLSQDPEQIIHVKELID